MTVTLVVLAGPGSIVPTPSSKAKEPQANRREKRGPTPKDRGEGGKKQNSEPEIRSAADTLNHNFIACHPIFMLDCRA